MNYLGKITVLTPPDKIFNSTLSYLLIKPSLQIKQQFHTILSKCCDDLTVFIFDQEETDIDWLLCVAHQADIVIIDIDNCDPITKQFITFLLALPHVHYVTNDELTPYGLINKNRIYDLDWIISQLDEVDFTDEEDDEDFEN